MAQQVHAVSSTSTTPGTLPVIQINGDNPAIIHIGDTYADLGTGPQADLNLGIKTFLNGAPMNPIQLDTTQASTDTIQYVVTDSTGLTATSTRTVIIEPAALLPSTFPSASTTEATSTAASSTTQ
jgi:hypothetical protein